MFFNTLKQFCQLHYLELIHAAKSALAFLIGYAFIQLIGDPQSGQPWLLVSIAVVMGTNTVLGMQLQKGYVRLLATLCGCALGTMVLLLPAHALTLPLLIAITAFAFMFIAVTYEKYSNIGLLGMITFCMIALAPHPTFSLAVDRTLETVSGILIALFVSAFVFPIHTEKLFAIHLSKNFLRLQQIYAAIFLAHESRLNNETIVEAERNIIKTHQKLYELANTPKYGFKQNKLINPITTKIILYERALYRYWVVIEVAQRILNEKKNNSFLTHQPDFELFIQDMIQYLTLLPENNKSAINTMLLSMIEHQRILQEKVTQHEARQEEISALQTICFITQRLCVVCHKLSYMLRKYKKITHDTIRQDSLLSHLP